MKLRTLLPGGILLATTALVGMQVHSQLPEDMSQVDLVCAGVSGCHQPMTAFDWFGVAALILLLGLTLFTDEFDPDPE